jgi:cytosine/adenosine deaminase-related metal-dependent hydrolase
VRYRLDAPDGMSLAVEDGRIADPAGSFELSIVTEGGEVRPGLINAHDHLQLNHYPRLGTPPYRNSYDWGNDLHARFTDEIARAGMLDRRSALLFGALKNLLGAVTTVVHHDVWHESLDAGFPLRVPRVHYAHSIGFDRDLHGAFEAAALAQRPICIHLAEGVDAESAAEVQTLAAMGWLNERLIAVHAVGVDADGIRLLCDARAAIVWCPTSNQFLLEKHAPGQLIASGIDVLMGTDSLLTAAGTMLDELRAARAVSFLDDAALLASVGHVAARRFGLPQPALNRGAAADFVILSEPVLNAKSSDVCLVVVGGQPRLGELHYAKLFDYCGVCSECLLVGGKPKLVAVPLADVAGQVCELTPECARIFN